MLMIDEETRALWRSQARKERLRELLNGIGAIATIALFAIMTWLFLVATPNQRSAEADAVAEQLEAAR